LHMILEKEDELIAQGILSQYGQVSALNEDSHFIIGSNRVLWCDPDFPGLSIVFEGVFSTESRKAVQVNDL